MELVEGVYDQFDRDAYLRGELAPVFFGSAVNLSLIHICTMRNNCFTISVGYNF